MQNKHSLVIAIPDDLWREFSIKKRKFKHGPDCSKDQRAQMSSGPHFNVNMAVKSVAKQMT